MPSTSSHVRPAAPGADQEGPAVAFDHGTPDGYDFFLQLGPLANANARYFKDDVPFWNEIMQHGTYDEFWQARNLRPHLKNIKPAVHDRRRLVRRREPVRRAGDLQDTSRPSSPEHHQHAGHGPLAPRRLGRVPTATSLGRVPFNSKTAAVLSREDRVAVLPVLPEGQGDAQASRRLGVRDRHQPVATYDAWPPAEARPRSFYLQATAAALGSDAARAVRRQAFDEYVSDPAQPVEYHRQDRVPGMTGDYMIQTSGSPRAGPTSGLPDARARDDLTLAGPIQRAVRLDHRHRLRLGRQADRRLSRRLPGPDPNPTGVQLGGYQQLVRGDVMRGKFRNSLRKPEPFVPDQPTPVNFTHPDVAHTFRTGHTDHGPGPEHLVPAGRPQSAEVRGHLHRQGGRLPESDPAGLPHQGDAVAPGSAGTSALTHRTPAVPLARLGSFPLTDHGMEFIVKRSSRSGGIGRRTRFRS